MQPFVRINGHMDAGLYHFSILFFFSLLHTQSCLKRFPHIVYLKMKTRLLYNNSNFDFVYCNWQKKMMVYFFEKGSSALTNPEVRWLAFCHCFELASLVFQEPQCYALLSKQHFFFYSRPNSEIHITNHYNLLFFFFSVQGTFDITDQSL